MGDFVTRGYSKQNFVSAPELAADHESGGEPLFAGLTRRHAYIASKRVFDIVVSILCLPLFLGLCCVLIVLNPFWNPGELFYLQRRMGKDRKGFIMLKFRSMTRENTIKRGADDPLETSRITPLGRWLRRSKADELPQILNVLLGEMSLIGPRPEVFSFAQTYRSVIPDYSIRESVRPGMTGYAQVKQGYTDTIEMARRKADLDAFYVRNMGWRLDLYVLAGTIAILCAPCKTRQ